MKNTVIDLLTLGSTLSKELARTKGAQIVQNNKTAIIDLTKPRSYSKNLIKMFCPHAKEPKLEVTHNFQLEGSRELSYRFKDGEVPLSGVGIAHRENGRIDFNINVVDSATKTERISASGMYNPNEPFFNWDNCGETLEHRFGRIIASADSSGFAIRTSVNDKSALKVLNDIKSFFKSI